MAFVTGAARTVSVAAVKPVAGQSFKVSATVGFNRGTVVSVPGEGEVSVAPLARLDEGEAVAIASVLATLGHTQTLTPTLRGFRTGPSSAGIDGISFGEAPGFGNTLVGSPEPGPGGAMVMRSIDGTPVHIEPAPVFSMTQRRDVVSILRTLGQGGVATRLTGRLVEGRFMVTGLEAIGG